MDDMRDDDLDTEKDPAETEEVADIPFMGTDADGNPIAAPEPEEDEMSGMTEEEL